MSRHLPALLALILAFPAPASSPASQAPRLLPNGWFYGEIGNGCMAARELPGGGRLVMRLVKWNDASDSLIFWARDLPPLMSEGDVSTGRTPAQEDADAEADFHLSVAIDGRQIPAAMGNYQMLDFEGKPGPSYRLGVAQQPFLVALAAGRSLEISRAGRPIATFPIAGSAAMARQMAECVARPPRL